MTPDPRRRAPQPIAPHAILAFVALALGTWQLAAARGTAQHQFMGWIWVALVAFVAASGLFIHLLRVFGAWSPIHVLSFVTLGFLGYAVAQAPEGQLSAHRRTMSALFWLALVVTGAFTFLPGRRMWHVATGG